MKFRSLGKSELEVSEISFGCMSLKADNLDAPTVIHKAMDFGVNFFDTADLYEFGMNEELLAKAIEGKRENLIIASKVGNEWDESKDGWTWNPSKSYIIKAVDESLRRLKTDYIDLYQLHGGTIDDPIDETIEAFEFLKQDGKIREYGISSIRPNVIREYARKSNIVSVMMQYSLLDRRPEEECLGLLRDHNISMITRGSLAKGLLCNKPAKEYLSHSTGTVTGVLEKLKAVAKNNGMSESAAATKYVLRQSAVASAVIGFRTVDQVDNLLEDFDKANLSEGEFNILENSLAVAKYDNHR